MTTLSPDRNVSHTVRLRERLKAIQQSKTTTPHDTVKSKKHDSVEPLSEVTQVNQPIKKQEETQDNLKLQTFSVDVLINAEKNSVQNEKQLFQIETEITYYQNQLNKIQLESNQLKLSNAEKDREIKKLQDSLQSIIGFGFGSGEISMTTRIVELSKKVRDLQSELYSEQNKTKQYETNQIDLQKILSQKESEIKNLSSQNENKSPAQIKQTEQFKDEINDLKAKLIESKNLCQNLKKEIQLTQKALIQELGPDAEKFTIPQILSSESNWKGRNQQIKSLKRKMSELKLQMSINTETSSDMNKSDAMSNLGDSQYASQMSISSLTSASANSQNGRQRDFLRKLETSRREASDKAFSELEEMKINFNEMKQKYNALVARNKIISDEQKQLKKELNENLTTIRKTDTETKNEMEISNEKLLKYKNTIENLKNELDTKNSQIENLNKKFKFKNFDKKISLPILEPSSFPSGRNTLSASDHNILTSERNLSRPEMDAVELTALYQSLSVERDKLRELVGLLQERLEETIQTNNYNAQSTRSLQQEIVILEKELTRYKSADRTASNKQKINKNINFEESSQSTSQDTLFAKFEVMEDENRTLQQRLELVNKNRREDLKIYKEMLETSRQIFTETIQKCKI